MSDTVCGDQDDGTSRLIGETSTTGGTCDACNDGTHLEDSDSPDTSDCVDDDDDEGLSGFEIFLIVVGAIFLLVCLQTIENNKQSRLYFAA